MLGARAVLGVCTLVIVGWVFGGRPANAAETLTRDDFVSLMERFESQISNIEIQADVEQQWTTRKLKGTPPDHFKFRTVLAGPAGNKFRLEFEGEVRDRDKMSATPSMLIRAMAFNGTRATEIRRKGEGEDKGRPTLQSIRRSRPDRDLNVFCPLTGMDLIPKYFNDAGLSTLLGRIPDWTLEKGSGQTYTITLAMPVERSQEVEHFEITVDLDRGGAITHLKVWYNPSAPSEYSIELRQVDDIWLPASSTMTNLASIVRTKFSAMKVNQELDDSIFTLNFEPGCSVTDEDTGESFFIAPPDDKLFLAEVEKSIEEVKSVADRQPMAKAAEAQEPVKENPSPAAQPGPKRGVRLLWWVAGAIALAALGAVIYRLLSPAAKKVLLLAALATGGACFQIAPRCLAAETGADDSYYYLDLGGRKVPVYQCGLYATTAVLRCAKIDCSVDLLRRYLKCGKEGTSLLAVKNALEAHGLAVEGVKSLGATQLAAHLAAGETAVIVINGPGGTAHFLAVLGMSGGSFLCVDYLRMPGKTDPKRMEAQLADSGGAALLVAAARSKPHADSVSVEPQAVDIGELRDKKEKIDAHFTLANRGDTTVLVRNIRIPCGGCMGAQMQQHWVEPGTSSDLVCSVDPTKWGNSHEKIVDVALADGRTYLAHIKASPYAPELDLIDIIPWNVFLTDSDFRGTAEVKREVRCVWVKKEALVLSEALSNAAWLKASVATSNSTDQEDSAARLEITATRVDAPGVAVAQVKCLFKGIRDPLTVIVRQYREPPFKITPAVAAVPMGSPEGVAVTLTTAAPESTYRILNVSGTPDGIHVEWPKGEIKGLATVKVTANDVDALRREGGEFDKLLATVDQAGVSVEIPIFLRVVTSTPRDATTVRQSRSE